MFGFTLTEVFCAALATFIVLFWIIPEYYRALHQSYRDARVRYLVRLTHDDHVRYKVMGTKELALYAAFEEDDPYRIKVEVMYSTGNVTYDEVQ